MIVLLHPVGLNPACWDALRLGGAAKPTYPGHGGEPRRAYDLDSLADEVVARYRGRLCLVGVSMGGMVGQHIALRHPDRVASVVLACTTGETDTDTMLQRADEAETHGMAGVLESTLERWFSASVVREGRASATLRYAADSLTEMDPAAYADAWRAMAKHAVLDQLAEVQAPVTCIAAKDDRSSPLCAMEAIHERVRCGRIVVMEGSHMTVLERPREFVQELARHRVWAREVAPRMMGAPGARVKRGGANTQHTLEGHTRPHLE